MILEETLGELRGRGELSGRAVRAVYPTGYFVVVELDDGSVGSAMSYFRAGAAEAVELRRRIEGIRESDPLLLGWLFEEPDPWARVGWERHAGRKLVGSLRVAVLSALSARRLRSGGDDTFTVTPTFPSEVFADARRALVIGYGGYMSYLAQAERVTHLHVCDWYYAPRRDEMEEFADHHRRRRPGLTFTFSDGLDAAARMREADIVAITGSALCNGTLEGLLELARGGPKVVVQGESAGVLPAALFRRGAALVGTTLKPPELARLAAADLSGELLKPLLEGGLPWIYLLPPGRPDPAAGPPAGR